LRTGAGRTFESLGNPNFMILWLGMLALMAGTQMQMLARGYLVYDITGSGAVLGIVNSGMAIPMLTISIFGGVIADRIDRKTVIQIGQFVAGTLALVVGILIQNDIITWQFLTIAAMTQGALFAFMMPARQAIIPQIVGPERLGNAMALNAAGMSAMTMAAPAAAGWLYTLIGPWNLYFVISALCYSSVVLTGLVPKTPKPTSPRGPVFKDILAGFDYIWKNQLLLVLILMGLSTTLLAMPFRFLMPIFVVDIYKTGPESMGMLVGVMGMGALIGSLYVASVGKGRRGLLLILASFASAAGLMMVSLVPIYVFAIFIMLPLGLGDAGRQTLNQSLIMEHTEDRYRGRVMSVYMLNFGLMPLGVLPSGVLADYLGGQATIGILAVALLLITSLILISQKRLRTLP
jgi:MFS family permease